jgi:hypothetical protein
MRSKKIQQKLAILAPALLVILAVTLPPALIFPHLLCLILLIVLRRTRKATEIEKARDGGFPGMLA